MGPSIFILQAAAWRRRAEAAEARVKELEAQLSKESHEAMHDSFFMPVRCTLEQPPGYQQCTRDAGHDGPCAILPIAASPPSRPRVCPGCGRAKE
jgi:hypothetical protein